MKTFIAKDVIMKPTVTIGDYCSIAEGVYFHWNQTHPCILNPKIVTSNSFHNWWGVEDFPIQEEKGTIEIGNDVWIGREAKILDGISIGDGAIVGAYSVVTKNVPPYAVVAGNPAVIKKFRFDQVTIDRLRKLKWWKWDVDTVKARMKDFLNVYIFLDKYEKEIL